MPPLNLDRRSFLCRSLLGVGALPPLLRRLRWLPAGAGPRKAPKAMVLIWLDGGLSHIDVFDGKPEAPGDVRGDAKWLRRGEVFLSDHLPQLADRLDRCALIRSLTHGEGNHDRASTFVLTGNRPSAVLEYPAMGALLGIDATTGDPLPAYVAIPDAPPAGGTGFLPLRHAPLAVPHDRSALPPGGAGEAARDELVDLLDGLDGAPRSPAEADRDALAQKARAMRADAEVRALFDPAGAEPEWRQRFGRHQLGQKALLAARLALGGVRTVLVRDTGWDHHRDVRRSLNEGFPGKLPQLDDAVSGVLDLLRARDAEDEVLLVVASEFGRNPRLNPDGGRDHWPRAQSVLLAGASVRAGVVHGTTDARAEEPATDACSPADLWATILAARGADLDAVSTTPDGRPVRAVPVGAAPIAAVLR